jgi:hypothetical protein
MGNFHCRIKRFSSLSRITPSRHEMFWTHWNLSAIRLFYGLAARTQKQSLGALIRQIPRIYDRFLTNVQFEATLSLTIHI